MTKAELIQKIASNTKITRTEASKALDVALTKTGISKATFLSLSVIAACPQSFWVFQKDSRQAGMTSM
jgi:hypothetical protein